MIQQTIICNVQEKLRLHDNKHQTQTKFRHELNVNQHLKYNLNEQWLLINNSED